MEIRAFHHFFAGHGAALLNCGRCPGVPIQFGILYLNNSYGVLHCNANCIQDNVEIGPFTFASVSPTMNLSNTGGSGNYFISNPPAALDVVTFSLKGSSLSPGSLHLIVGQADQGLAVWQPTTIGCRDRTMQFTLPATTFNAARVNGSLTVQYFAVNNGTCPGAGTLQITTAYAAGAISPDCNGNGLPDQCDLIPATNPLPPGNCAQAEAVCPGYTYAHSNEHGSLNSRTDTPCVGWWTSGNVFYKYTPSDSGPLKVEADYSINAPHGLQPVNKGVGSLFPGVQTSA